MAETEKRIIDVEVRESGLDDLNTHLKNTEQNLKETAVQSGNASNKLEEVGKNGGAIATLDRLTGGLASQIRDAWEASKAFNISLYATRGALIATGIGAFVVALGVVVAYWDDISDYVTGVNKKLEAQLTLIERKGELLEAQIGVVDAEAKLLEAQGKSTDEIIKKKKTLLQAQIGILGAELATLNAQREQLNIELTREAGRKAAISFATKGILDLKTSQEPLNEIDNKIFEITQKVLGAQTALQSLINGDTSGDTSDREKEKKTTDFEKDGITGLPLKDIADATIQANVILGEQADVRNAMLLAKENERLTAMKIINDNEAKSVELLEQRKMEARLIALQGSANALMAFGDLVGQTTGAGKALASAGALVNTFLGITEIFSTKSVLPEPFATISRIANVAAVAASGFAAVRNINRVQIPNVNISSPYFSGGGGGSSQPAQVQPPSFNIVGNSSINQLADTIREKEEKPVRAYVVSEDIENQAQLDRSIRKSAVV